MKLAVLVASHNRRDATLGCMSRLLPQLGEDDGVYLVDDGSTDGTAVAVAGLKDKRIKVIDGDGRLYWAKGMRKVWEEAVAERDDWDGFLWLNDDTELCSDAIAKMMAVNEGESIVVGELENSKGEIVYGMRPGGLFTGNCVFVPCKVYERLGMICGEYSHAWADSDYAMQAKRAGIGVVSAGIVGKAEGHPNRPSLKGLSLSGRIAMLRNPKGWNVHDLWLYRLRNWGVVTAVASCTHLVLHVLCGGALWKKLANLAPWIIIWLGYLAFGLWIRGGWDVTADRFQVHGYDYADYTWFLTDWREICYPRPRHPLWGVFSFPIVLLCGGLKSLSFDICLIFINALFAAVMTSCVWMVTKVLKCGWPAGLLYACFASSLLLGGMPESFAVSALISLVAVSWYIRGDISRKGWLALGIVAGGVTITQGVKVFLLRFGFMEGGSFGERLRRLLRIGMWCLFVGCIVGVLFVVVWLLRKWNNPDYERTLLDMLHDLATEFSYSDMSWSDRLSRWWVFFSEPLVTRGTEFEDNVIVGEYSNKLIVLVPALLLVLSALGVWFGRRRAMVKALLTLLSVDVLIHFLCGWGMREPHIYAGHWTYAVPILCIITVDAIKAKAIRSIAKSSLLLLAVVILTINLCMYGVLR